MTQRGDELEISYGKGTDFPQYGALHLNDSYFRLNYGPASGWGTSIVLLPSFWSSGTYYQGAPITTAHQVVGQDLELSFKGTITTATGDLVVSSTVRLSPPVKNISATAHVTTAVTVNGEVVLDNRPGEAFKPVMLSSMHIAHTTWDTQAAYANCGTFPITSSGWITQPPIDTHIFGLFGGTSTWKTNAPTIQVILDRPLQVTGWVTQSNDPNGDNVAFWAATTTILPSWSFEVSAFATSGSNIHCIFLPTMSKG